MTALLVPPMAQKPGTRVVITITPKGKAWLAANPKKPAE